MMHKQYKIRRPGRKDIPALKALWKEAFGDTDVFIDDFFSIGFSPKRALCAYWENQPVGALYWFRGDVRKLKVVYFYGLAVKEEHRGHQLGRALLEKAKAHLRFRGCHGGALVPGNGELKAYYKKLGLQPFGTVRRERVKAGDTPLPIRELTADEYALERRKEALTFAINHSPEFLRLVGRNARFYVGERVAAAVQGDTLLEFMGSPRNLPGLLRSLELEEAWVWKAGDDQLGAMYMHFTENKFRPSYLFLPLN